MQKTCKWYTHLTYLHLEIHSLKINCKIQTKTSTRTPVLGNRAISVMRLRWLLWKGRRSLPVRPRSRECDNKQTKYWFCYLNLPVTLISGRHKLVAYQSIMTIWCCKTVPKVQIMSAALFSGNAWKLCQCQKLC